MDELDPMFELLEQYDDSQFIHLTSHYLETLEQAIEEAVDKVSLILTYERYFSEQEYKQIMKRMERGGRVASSKLLLRLVMEKKATDGKLIWKYFVKMHHLVPKLGKLLKEMEEQGADLMKSFKKMHILSEMSDHLKDVQKIHKEALQVQTETLKINTILMKEEIKDFPLLGRYAELTVISSIRDLSLVEHELLARGRVHEQWRENQLQQDLEKIQIDHLFQSSFSCMESKFGRSAAVAGVAGIGKTTMVQKIVHDWATGKIYHDFQFVFCFKFRELNSVDKRISLMELVLNQYPYFGNTLRDIWKNPQGLLFIFDGLDEFKHKIDFSNKERYGKPQHMCPDPECWCEVTDIVYSLIQHKLLPGCSVLLTTRPTALYLLEKAEINVWAEILGFVGEERKEYFKRFFEDQTVAAAVNKHVEENELLYTMSYNPSYCWILALALGPFFTQQDRDPRRVPKTITQLYSHYIYNILKNHSLKIENSRDLLLRVGRMAFTGVSEKKIVFTCADLEKYDLQPSQFLSGFLMELFELKNSTQSMVYTFPHLTIQEFVAAVTQYLTANQGDILKFLTEAHSTIDGRFEIFLRFVAGLSSPLSARPLEDFLGKFPHQTTCRVIDWVKEEVQRQIGNTWSEAGKRSLLNTLHYLFESQNRALAQATLGSMEALSLTGLVLTPIDCTVLSLAIVHCETIKCLNLEHCKIHCEGLQRLATELHKCQELGLGGNELGDSGVQLVASALKKPDCKIQKVRLFTNRLTASCGDNLAAALSTNHSLTVLNLNDNNLGDAGVKPLTVALRNPNCIIQKLWLNNVGLTDSCAEDIATILHTNPSLIEVYLGHNKLGDSGVKLLCVALKNPMCKIRKLWLWANSLTDSCTEDLVSALSTQHSMREVELGSNSFTDRSVPALCRLLLNLPKLEWIGFRGNPFSSKGESQLQETRPRLTVAL
ncbi:NACHT, LRR and PYD domains-containing protein 3-like [Narcine bancroftii]|uniref:NACHT, LRR and PYD domains-containing protein 3-like n=1 Tax=Narcine bancroftii TaxID=1343680 RepID=UPI00383172E7